MINHLDALKANKQNKVYKVFNTTTGLYSRGGTDIQRCNYCWTNKGKTWSSVGNLKLHLMQYVQENYIRVDGKYKKGPATITIPDDWEVVEIDLELAANASPNAVKTYNAKTFMMEHIATRRKR